MLRVILVLSGFVGLSHGFPRAARGTDASSSRERWLSVGTEIALQAGMADQRDCSSRIRSVPPLCGVFLIVTERPGRDGCRLVCVGDLELLRSGNTSDHHGD